MEGRDAESTRKETLVERTCAGAQTKTSLRVEWQRRLPERAALGAVGSTFFATTISAGVCSTALGDVGHGRLPSTHRRNY